MMCLRGRDNNNNAQKCNLEGNSAFISYLPKTIITIKGHLYPQAISYKHLFFLISDPKLFIDN